MSSPLMSFRVLLTQFQSRVGFLRNILQLRILADDAERDEGRHRGDGEPVGPKLIPMTLGQQHVDFELGAQGTVCQRRIAGPENHVVAEGRSGFCLSVSFTSMVVNTPNPCAFSATVTRSTACP